MFNNQRHRINLFVRSAKKRIIIQLRHRTFGELPVPRKFVLKI
jgi:hypothetical protein